MIAIYISIGVLAALLTLLIFAYNSITKKKLRVENAFSQIKIQCKKKADLVPYLADVLKSYVSLDNNLFSSSTADLSSVQGIAEVGYKTDNQLRGLIAIADQNPKAKTSINFLQVQNELTNVEKAISVSRGFYNDAVMMHNRFIQVFPINIFAKIFRCKAADFLDESSFSSSSFVRGSKCQVCGAISDGEICQYCGARISII